VSVSGRVLGTYVHGFFDNDDFRHAFLAAARRAVDLAPAETWANIATEREMRIDRLADHLRKSLDMNLIRSWIIAPSNVRRIKAANHATLPRSSLPVPKI
jgi:adenosylcobyric acid synthase